MMESELVLSIHHDRVPSTPATTSRVPDCESAMSRTAQPRAEVPMVPVGMRD